MGNSGLNNSKLKQQNRGIILRLLATDKCSSRIEIAKETGLSKMAATNIISEFIDEGIIEESEERIVGGKGRNPIILKISGRAPKIIGIHISGNSCGVYLCDYKLNVLKGSSFSVSGKNKDKLFGEIFKRIDAILSEYAGERISGIGVGASGPVDVRHGVLLGSSDLFGTQDIDIFGILKEKYKYPVFVEHEYDCSALAELFFGAGRDLSNFVFVSVSREVGSALISGGQLFRSESGFNSEIGHICIDINGRPCRCGRRGCLETYISTRRLEEELREKTGEELSFREFCEKYNDTGSKGFDEVLNEASGMFSEALTNSVNFSGNLNYIIGLEGRYIPERFVADLTQRVNEKIMFKRHRRVRILSSEIRKELQSSVCACAVLERVFRGDMDSLLHQGTTPFEVLSHE
ncbi:MAG: ROK family transcriptional regulator [Lachnospiraceae bacterium]|nr:ROK family transcriptional regulator [Lachnospiraceae bacterium]